MRRAFTMVELVVVMAILAVLAAVIFPVFGQAVHKARDTSCVSNVHQVYLAAQLYRQDEGDYPRIMIENPVMKPYFGGTPPICPAAKPHWTSYGITASMAYGPEDLADPDTKDWFRAFRECAEKRGPDLPVVLDENHIDAREGYRSGESFFILARESGAIERIPSDRLRSMFSGTAPMPCSRRAGVENL